MIRKNTNIAKHFRSAARANSVAKEREDRHEISVVSIAVDYETTVWVIEKEQGQYLCHDEQFHYDTYIDFKGDEDGTDCHYIGASEGDRPSK